MLRCLSAYRNSTSPRPREQRRLTPPATARDACRRNGKWSPSACGSTLDYRQGNGWLPQGANRLRRQGTSLHLLRRQRDFRDPYRRPSRTLNTFLKL